MIKPTYWGTHELKLKDNLITLPDVIADALYRRNPDGVKFEAFKHIELHDDDAATWFVLYDSLTKARAHQETIHTPYNGFEVKKNSLYLPKKAKKFLDLEEKVTLLGAGDHIELWKPEYLAEKANESPVNSYKKTATY